MFLIIPRAVARLRFPIPRSSKEPPPKLLASRRKSVDRRLWILAPLTIVLSIAHLARVEQLTARRMRQFIAQVLASREIDPSAGFVQLQMARLSEAKIVARTMMMKGDLQAMHRWIELTSELDRYHGLALARAPEAGAPRRLAGAPLNLAESGPLQCRREIFRLATP